MQLGPLKTLRRALKRTLIDPANRHIDAWRMNEAIRQLRGASAADRKLLRRLHRAWGNEAYSADVTYVGEVAKRVPACSGPILECGSGLTTIVAGILAERRGLSVWSLEQDADWAEHVGRFLKSHEIANTRVIHAPLKRYGDYVWYDIEGIELPSRFDLVVCDGPAVFEHWGDAFLQWRYGVLPVLASRSIGVGEILLDDATEPRAARLLTRWSDEFAYAHRLLESADGDCALASRQGYTAA